MRQQWPRPRHPAPHRIPVVRPVREARLIMDAESARRGPCFTPAQLAAMMAYTIDVGPRKVLECAADVCEALKAEIPPSDHAYDAASSFIPAMESYLIGIDIVILDSLQPGHWRLIRHDHCEVDAGAGTVSHDLCSVMDEGTIRSER